MHLIQIYLMVTILLFSYLSNASTCKESMKSSDSANAKNQQTQQAQKATSSESIKSKDKKSPILLEEPKNKKSQIPLNVQVPSSNADVIASPEGNTLSPQSNSSSLALVSDLKALVTNRAKDPSGSKALQVHESLMKQVRAGLYSQSSKEQRSMLNRLSARIIHTFNSTDIQKIVDVNIPVVSDRLLPTQIPYLTLDQINYIVDLYNDQLHALTKEQILFIGSNPKPNRNQLSYRKIADRLLPSQIPWLSTDSYQFKSLYRFPSVLKHFSKNQIQALSTDQLEAIPMGKLKPILNHMLPSQLSGLLSTIYMLKEENLRELISLLPPDKNLYSIPVSRLTRRGLIKRTPLVQLLSTEQISVISTPLLEKLVTSFTEHQVQGLSVSQLLSLSPKVIKNIAGKLSITQLSQLSVIQGKALRKKDIKSSSDQLFISAGERLSYVSPDAVSSVKPRRLKSRRFFIFRPWIRDLSPQQVSKLPHYTLIKVLKHLTKGQIQEGLTKVQIQNLSARKIRKIVKKLSVEQLSWLTADQGRLLKPKHIIRPDDRGLVTRNLRIQAVSPDAVSSVKPRRLKSRRFFISLPWFYDLSPQQVSKLKRRTLKKIITELSDEQIQRGLTKEQIQDLPLSVIKKVIHRLSTDQFSWLNTNIPSIEQEKNLATLKKTQERRKIQELAKKTVAQLQELKAKESESQEKESELEPEETLKRETDVTQSQSSFNQETHQSISKREAVGQLVNTLGAVIQKKAQQE